MACSKRHFSQFTPTQERTQKKIELEVPERDRKKVENMEASPVNSQERNTETIPETCSICR
jgi:hypothetical protein